ncbi:hypothetical protein [Haloimpatiens massiliensis]|uniref:hypothetical protein n=1 Tax=Haloimpatiens massiliensis TaxID=1658110 RepID=UPI000C84D581|nr:hypothetical protein [Haloimpatiens massiliensis]
MLNWRNIVLSSIVAGTLIAPTATYGVVNLNNSFVESCKIYNEPNGEQEKCPNCKEEHEIFQKRMEDRMEERSKLIEEADKIVPGIKAQWQQAVNERRELLNKLRENRAHKDEGTKKDRKEKERIEKNGSEKQREEKEKSENREKIKEANKKKWEDLNEAVKAKDAQKVRSSFDLILQSMKERNEKLSEKINNAKE